MYVFYDASLRESIHSREAGYANNEDNFKEKERNPFSYGRWVCPFSWRRKTRREEGRRVLSTDRHFDGFNGPISILRRSFYRAMYTDLSLIIGFARHCVASVREISARDRSFQPFEKFMSCAGRTTRERGRKWAVWSISISECVDL